MAEGVSLLEGDYCNNNNNNNNNSNNNNIATIIIIATIAIIATIIIITIILNNDNHLVTMVTMILIWLKKDVFCAFSSQYRGSVQFFTHASVIIYNESS